VQPSSSPSAFPSFGMPLFMQYVAAKLLLNYLARPGRRFVAPRVISLRRGNSVAFGAKRKSGPFMSTRPSSAARSLAGLHGNRARC
jgi:hypothetical protein